jgi:hypothetical protein
MVSGNRFVLLGELSSFKDIALTSPDLHMGTTRRCPGGEKNFETDLEKSKELSRWNIKYNVQISKQESRAP